MGRTTLTGNLRPLEGAGMLRVARAPGDARVRVVLSARQLRALRSELFALIEAAPASDESEAAPGRSVEGPIAADWARGKIDGGRASFD